MDINFKQKYYAATVEDIHLTIVLLVRTVVTDTNIPVDVTL